MKHRLLLAFAFLAATSASAGATPAYDVIAALQNIRAGRNAEALPLLSGAIASGALRGGELADAFEWRAFLHEGRRDRGAARADLDAAIRAESENPLRFRARARFLLRTGSYAAALADIDAALLRAPADAENYADHCEILLALGRRADAGAQCRRAVKVDPDNKRAAALLRRLGQR